MSFNGIGGLAEGASTPLEDARANRAATASTRTTSRATARRRRRVERCMGTDADSSEGRSLPGAAAADALDDSVRRARGGLIPPRTLRNAPILASCTRREQEKPCARYAFFARTNAPMIAETTRPVTIVPAKPRQA